MGPSGKLGRDVGQRGGLSASGVSMPDRPVGLAGEAEVVGPVRAGVSRPKG